MSRSDILLWTMVILVVIVIGWLIMSGRLQAVTTLLVNGYWKFMEGFLHSFRR